MSAPFWTPERARVLQALDVETHIDEALAVANSGREQPPTPGPRRRGWAYRVGQAIGAGVGRVVTVLVAVAAVGYVAALIVGVVALIVAAVRFVAG